jgi:hypothetical protein
MDATLQSSVMDIAHWWCRLFGFPDCRNLSAMDLATVIVAGLLVVFFALMLLVGAITIFAALNNPRH